MTTLETPRVPLNHPSEEIVIGRHPSGKGYLLETTQLLACPLEEVFAIFSDAFQLERITPPWLHFQVLTPAPIEMATGTLIDYRLRLHGIPLRWRTRIAAWEPPYRFIDEQLKGPYRWWVHEHTFEETPSGILMKDRVDYGFIGGSLVHRWFVKGDLRRIFEYRRSQIETILGKPSHDDRQQGKTQTDQ